MTSEVCPLTLSKSARVADILSTVAPPPVPPHPPCLRLLYVPLVLPLTPALRHASPQSVAQFGDGLLPVGEREQDDDDDDDNDDPEGDVPVVLQPQEDGVEGLLREQVSQDVQKVIVINTNTTA